MQKNFHIIGAYYCLIMQTTSYEDPNFYSNTQDETACINEYAPAWKLFQKCYGR